VTAQVGEHTEKQKTVLFGQLRHISNDGMPKQANEWQVERFHSVQGTPRQTWRSSVTSDLRMIVLGTCGGRGPLMMSSVCIPMHHRRSVNQGQDHVTADTDDVDSCFIFRTNS